MLSTPADFSRRALVAGGLAMASLSPAWPVTGAPPPASSLPPLGLGSCCDDYDQSYDMVLGGLRTGFRLIDTAAHYESEAAVGAALVEARRRGLLTDDDQARTVTKIWFDDMGYESALASAKRSMKQLQTEQLDVLLIHFPGSIDAVQSPSRNRKLRADTWRACEALLKDGMVRKVGVSNWNARHLRETLASCVTPPQVLQTELHPRLPQVELVDFARESGVETIMAHCPLAHGSPALLRSPTLVRLAEARGDGTTPAMLCLRWSLDRGLLPVPKASSAARLAENWRALRMPPLSASERAAVDSLEAEDGRVSFDPKLIA